MADAPTCPRHGHPLEVVEEGMLNGTLVRYWAGCPGVPCQQHEHAVATGRCRCRPCRKEVRTEDVRHEEPSLFGGEQ